MVFMQHLVGRRMPNVDLEATSGSPVNPAKIIGPAVIFCYPFTGRPGYPNPPNWDFPGGLRAIAEAGRVVLAGL